MTPDVNQAAYNRNLEAARHYLRTNRPAQAIESARACLSSVPDAYEPHTVLASAFMQAENWPTAEQEVGELLRLGPTNHQSYYLAARYQTQRGQLVPAVTYLQNGIRIAPHNADLWALLAECQRDRGKRDEAIVAAREAVRWAPTHADYRTLLAVLETPRLPTRTQARVLVAKLLDILTLDPENRYTWESLARIYAYALGDWPAVVEAVSRALIRDPHDSVKQRLLHDANIRQYWAYRAWSAPYRLLKIFSRNLRAQYTRSFSWRQIVRLFLLLYNLIIVLAVMFCLGLTFLSWWWPADWLSQKLIPRGIAPLRPGEDAAVQRKKRRVLNLLFTTIWLSPPLILAPFAGYAVTNSKAGPVLVVFFCWMASYLSLGTIAMAKLGDSYRVDWAQRRKERREQMRAAKSAPTTTDSK